MRIGVGAGDPHEGGNDLVRLIERASAEFTHGEQ